jgi:meiosis-specific APC/C activator protein AMA1
LVGSGTNAPLYTASFSNARPKAQEDLENHEGRLAEALELDRNARVLEFRDPSFSTPKPPTIGRTKGSELDSRAAWDGTEWVIDGADLSKSQPTLFD